MVLKYFELKIYKDFSTVSNFRVQNCSNVLNMNFSQKESTHFRLGVLGHFGPKKSGKIKKEF